MRVVGKYWERCEKVCWSVGEVRDVGGSVGNVEKCWDRCEKGRCGERCGDVEVLGKVWESVLECGGGRGHVVKCVGVRGKCGEVLGEVWGSVLGWGRGRRRCWGVGKCWERCEKVCWGVPEVRGDVGDVKMCWERCGKGRCVGGV